ncbi:MAG: 50S ribosomal protein L25 [Thermodesulfobacteriota bacterium]
MFQETLDAAVRHTRGKGGARSLRRQGRTPAVLYGPGTKAVALSFESKELTRALLRIHEQNAVLTLNVSGDDGASQHHVMVKEVQTDPVGDDLLHADFYEISLQEKRRYSVPLQYTGKALGVDQGGSLLVAVQRVHVEGLPLSVPDAVEVDVAGLDLGGKILLKELTLPAGVELKDNPETLCVSVAAPSRTE